MSLKTKKVLATLSVIMVFIFSGIYLIVPMFGGYNWLAWMLGILNLAAGPTVLAGYIVEVRKGIFKDVEEEANKEE
mgnify:CR=1 FL=1